MTSSIHTNHLVIGLGGTGGLIIRSLRKRIYQISGSDDAPGVNIRYLYIDTSDELMGREDPGWKILGRSVQLPERSQLLITGINFRDVVNNLSNYPGISPWLGSREDFIEILSSSDAAKVVGGQKRRLGRFLFATAAGAFVERVENFVRDMHETQRPQVRRSTETTFHVCCGLAGGTGSGAVVDAVAQVRKKFPGPEYRINLYAMLPERHPAGQKAGVNYHANGYAALKELSALGVSLWHPHDLLGDGKAKRLEGQDPFNCCYLFNDENEANVKVDVSRELPDIVASFLYQKIVEIQHIEWKETNTLLRQETFEVGSQAKTPEKSAKDKPRRSRSFFSFGIKQIAYPDVEISEYLTYSFARQAVLQLLYNKWVEGQGFKDEAVNQPFQEFVREKSTLEKWYLTEERLSLSEGILKGEIGNKKWRTIGDFWKTVVPGYVTMVLDSYREDVLKTLPELTKLCDEAYREQYRGEGVSKFYETKRQGDLREQVKEVRGRIEGDLFEEWKNGVKSMFDIARLLDALLGMVEERINGMDDRIAKSGEDSERYKTNEATIGSNRQEWAKLGKFSIMMGKHQTLLNAQAECLITRYTMRTRLEGMRYAKDLLVNLRGELQSLSSEVNRARTLADNASKAFMAAIDSRCNDTGTADLSRQVVRFYDPETVKGFARDLAADQSEQRKQCAKVRARLAERLGERQTFASFNSRYTEFIFRDVLEIACKESSEEAHQDFVSRYPDRERVLNVGLLDLLRREFEGNDERLSGYVRGVMSMAKNYLKLEPSEVQFVGPGIRPANNPAEAVCVTNLTVIVPEAPEARDFRQQLCKSIENTATVATQTVTNARRRQEITFISITNVFPARFVSVVSYLRDAYRKRLAEGGARAYLELHLEGNGDRLPGGEEVPDLFPETYQPSDLRPWVMIADAMGLLKIDTDTSTGHQKVYLVVKDRDGFDQMEELGPSTERIIQAADVGVFETIRDVVEPRLESDYRHLTRREELLSQLRKGVEETGRSHKSNDPVFIEQRSGFSKAREILNMEDQGAHA